MQTITFALFLPLFGGDFVPRRDTPQSWSWYHSLLVNDRLEFDEARSFVGKKGNEAITLYSLRFRALDNRRGAFLVVCRTFAGRSTAGKPET